MGTKKQPHIGVSIDFFVAAERCLRKRYGPRLCGSGMERFRAALAEAEEAYKSLPREDKTI